MWHKTVITELLNIEFPIIQAPMAGATTPELVAAVSNAGGLGSLGAGYMSADEIRKAVKKIRLLTNKPFGVNLFIPEKHQASTDQIEKARKIVEEVSQELHFHITGIEPPYAPSFDEQMKVVLEEKVPVFSFTFGIPAKNWIEDFKKNGIFLIGTATTLEEAELLEECHIDAIVAQGSEAGGHRGTFLGKAEDALTKASTLVQSLAKNINLPIIAAGGIMDAKSIKQMLESGASALQMGTAFLCCHESGIHPNYKKALLSSKVDDTTLTRAFSGKLARGLNNKFIQRMEAHQETILDYPIQNALTQAMRKEANKQGCTDFMSMWTGQSSYLCKNISAAELIQILNDELP